MNTACCEMQAMNRKTPMCAAAVASMVSQNALVDVCFWSRRVICLPLGFCLLLVVVVVLKPIAILFLYFVILLVCSLFRRCFFFDFVVVVCSRFLKPIANYFFCFSSFYWFVRYFGAVFFLIWLQLFVVGFSNDACL